MVGRYTYLIVALALTLTLAGSVWAQKNPCNPCGGKVESTSHGPAVNPCHAKFGTVFYVADPMARNTVSFESRAPLEDIIGSTNQIEGYLVFDPGNPSKGGRGHFVVPVSSLKTGIPLRDEHLQGAMWLDAAGHPEITLVIEAIEDVEPVKVTEEFKTYDVRVVGEFSLHGKTKSVSIPGRITYMPESEVTRQKMPGDLLAARASFEVDLEDYGVEGMAGIVGSKVSETITVDVSLVGSSASETAGNPCNPCGGKKKTANPCGGKEEAANPCGDK